MVQSIEYRDTACLRVKIAKLDFPNPLILASGILGISASLVNRVIKVGAGGIVLKTISYHPRVGYDNPVLAEAPSGILNALGTPNPGYSKMGLEIKKIINSDVPIISSIMGDSPDSFSALAEKIEKYKVNALELNVSCPHVKKMGSEIGEDPDTLMAVVEAVKSSVNIPVFAKLTPNVTSITRLAAAALDGGADALVAINTVKAMGINVETQKPILSNKIGGLSGPTIKPIGLRCIFELSRELDAPLIGVGGIVNWRDALEYILAGAKAVQIGSGIAYRGLNIFPEIKQGIKDYLENENLASITELTGRAHKQ